MVDVDTAHDCPLQGTLSWAMSDKPSVERMARAKKKISCSECKQIFSRKGELQQHRREEHSRRNVCLVCKRTFESEKRLKMHSQFHNVGGEYKCFYCPKQFNKAWKMKIHLVNHSGRPSYICQYCGDDFLYPGKIVSHLKRIHDVCYACKDCGQAIPIECSQRPHKCKIYGCKDCLMSFASQAELAAHVASHADQEQQTSFGVLLLPATSPPPPPVSLPSSAMAGQERRVTNSEPCDHPPLVAGNSPKTQGEDAENINTDTFEGRLVVAEDVGDSKSDSAENGESEEFPLVVEDDSCYPKTNNRSGGSPHDLVTEDSCDIRIGNLKVGERLRRDMLIGQGESPPVNLSYKWSVQEGSGRVDDTSLTLLLKGSSTPAKSPTMKNDEELPSYFSSVLLRSPCNVPCSTSFKVPESSVNRWKKFDPSTRKSLRRKQEELDKAMKKKEDLLNKFHFYVDTDARLTQRSQTSFESWLTSDSFSTSDHDYVFGFEASLSMGNHQKETHYHYFNKKVPKKEKVDMTFEDLCLF